jgi:hypothetical protein
VDGRTHKPDSIPMLLDGARVHFLRYGGAPFLVNWNAAFDGELSPLLVADGAARVADGSVKYELEWSGDRPALAAMTITNGGRALRLAFDPAFPDVVTLTGAASGVFTIDAGAGGTVAGHYRAERMGDEVDITLHPDDGWRPGPAQLGARLIFRLVPLFRRWPATYVWRGQVDLSGARPRLASTWERSAAAGQGAIKLFGQADR